MSTAARHEAVTPLALLESLPSRRVPDTPTEQEHRQGLPVLARSSMNMAAMWLSDSRIACRRGRCESHHFAPTLPPVAVYVNLADILRLGMGGPARRPAPDTASGTGFTRAMIVGGTGG
jgi:hypothetical protein